MKKYVFTAFAAMIISACGNPAKSEEPTTLLGQWEQDKKAELQAEWDNMAIKDNGNTLKIWYQYYGNAPFGDRSMWISMHGGGNAPASLNDSQWNNQKKLYKPSEGLYVAPRAPWNDWDLWFKEGLDALFHRLITAAIIFEGVNPDKVYLMGYSAGGDGVWRMAPRMADTWAAASMMAGHPGDVSLLPLRNLPFMIWCGGEDAAYDRNKECAKRGEELDALQAADPEGYIHETHIVAGKPHWMDLEDAAAVPWMQKYTRNPYPQKVVWVQGDSPCGDFYWLGVDKSSAKKGMKLVATRSGNTITIEESDFDSVRIGLNGKMIDASKPVVVLYGGKTVFEGKVTFSEEVEKANLYARNDPRYAFPATITVTL